MEMYQVMLGYPQIHTDMKFETKSTLPLEYRAGVECNIKKSIMMDYAMRVMK